MNHPILILALFATLTLAACDRPAPTVINVPATPVAVPGPAGPQGATGNQGSMGSQGEPGKPAQNMTVIVTPPASAPTY